MFFFLKFLLLFITATNSRPNNYFTNETTRAYESNETLPMILTADSSNGAKQDDKDVELTGYGYSVNLTLAYEFLDVKIDLNNCIGRVKFCYSSLEKNDDASLRCGNGFCGFWTKEKSNNKKIDLMDVSVRKSSLDKPCLPIRMKQTETSYCGVYAASCKPLIEDNRITIIVEEVSSDCRIFIKHATIYYSPTTSTTSLPSKESPTSSITSEASIEWYIWFIIGVTFAFTIAIIIIIYVCWKKQICLFKEKTEAKKKITIMDTVDSGIITKAEDIPEPKLESKPETKPKTKTAEEIPRPPKAAKKSKKISKKSKKSKKGKKQKKPAKKYTVDDPFPETPVADLFENVEAIKTDSTKNISEVTQD
uniref:Uncharacterized protein n=1 Tax=Panagrolaimus davidi TaxID=227884 RepID=A0A914PCD0_9BILA